MLFRDEKNESLGLDFIRRDIHKVPFTPGPNRMRVAVRIYHGEDCLQSDLMTIVHDMTIPPNLSSDELFAKVEAPVHTRLSQHFFYKGCLKEIDIEFQRLEDSPTLTQIPLHRFRYDLDAAVVERVPETGEGCVWDILKTLYKIEKRSRPSGVTPGELRDICANHKIRLLVLGLHGKVITQTVPQKRNSRKRPLVIVAANEHAYLLARSSAAVALKTKKLPVQRSCIPIRHHLNKRLFDETFLHISQNHHILRGVVTKGINIVRFEHANNEYHLSNVDIQAIHEDCSALGVSAIDSVIRLMRTVQSKHTIYFPEIIFPLSMQVPMKHAPFVFYNKEHITSNNLRAFDVRRCYTNALRGEQCSYRWTIPSEFDKIVKYDNKALSPGRYYVQTSDEFPTKGNGWYWYAFVKFMQTTGIPCTILLQQRAKIQGPVSTCFEPFVSHVISSVSDANAKMYINHFIGSCKASRKPGPAPSITTTSHREALAYADAIHTPATHIEKLGQFYYICNASTKDFLGDRSYIYEQVIERSWILVYNLWVLLGKRPIAYINTDCICVISDNTITPDPARYREEAVKQFAFAQKQVQSPTLFTSNSTGPDYAEYTVRYTPFSIQNLDGSHGALVTGVAGTGKTTLVQDAISRVIPQKRIQVVAPTNRAASQAGGCTVHRYLGITTDMVKEQECVPHNRYLRLLSKQVDIIWVDECFMCEQWMWQAFLKLKHLGVIFILSGDPHQLPPISSLNVSSDSTGIIDTAIVCEIADAHLITLQTIHRSTTPLARMVSFDNSMSIHQIIDAIPSEDDIHKHRRHLAFTNKTCQRINKEMLLHMIGKKRKALTIHLTDKTSKVTSPTSSTQLNLGTDLVVTCDSVLITNDKIKHTNGWILKNEICNVVGWCQRSRTFNLRFEASTYSVSFEDCHKLALGFCITIHKSQSSTIYEPYCIHDITNISTLKDKILQKALLYVACTRAGAGSAVYKKNPT